jgi:Tol biopolymer transport system component
LVWYDRKGNQLGLAAPAGEYQNPEVTRNGRLVVFQRGNPPNIYVLDTQKGVTTRVTTDMAGDTFPVWAPDERTIVFASARDASRDQSLYTRVFDAVGEDKLLHKTQVIGPDGWSNNYITYDSFPPQRHIWAYSLTDSKAKQLTFSDFSERGGRLSPDGHWLAYTALEQQGSELFIQSFPDAVTKRQFSTGGGSVIRWGRDGKELYYVAPDAYLMAVSITSTGETSAPKRLFKAPVSMTGATRDYDVTADGRFLINVTNPAALNPVAPPISVDLNWIGALHKN